MQRIMQSLENHHKHCDDAFAAAEAAVVKRQWDEASRLQDAFRAAMEAHFEAEESLLFPAFEAATGHTSGPTEVMRTEHSQIRNLLGAMADALAGKDADDFFGHAGTLVIMMQQHNLKEENILYPMCDSSLSGNADELAERLRSALDSGST
nr:hemerythrin domain-containing protein [Rhodoferax sp.]